jgi:hypothetical protein
VLICLVRICPWSRVIGHRYDTTNRPSAPTPHGLLAPAPVAPHPLGADVPIRRRWRVVGLLGVQQREAVVVSQLSLRESVRVR